jgi:hypothetical protein
MTNKVVTLYNSTSSHDFFFMRTASCDSKCLNDVGRQDDLAQAAGRTMNMIVTGRAHADNTMSNIQIYPTQELLVDL